ncbi:MAG TPA: hypothetical protein VLG09_05320 [Candidatus Saccharimonadales bacterium]|nr:hypothetical protein [Candidatus Saccharimonadales bacterium]
MERAPSIHKADQEPDETVSAETVSDLEFAFLVSPDSIPAMGGAALRNLDTALAPAAYENALERVPLNSKYDAEAAKGDPTRTAIGSMATYRNTPPNSERPSDVDTTYGNDDREP